MDIIVKDLTEIQVKADALILPFFEDSLHDYYSDVDNAIGGIIKKIISSKEFSGKHGQMSLIHVNNIGSERILLSGLGKASEITSERIRQAGGKAFSYLREINVSDIAVSNSIFSQLLNKSSGFRKPVFYLLEGGLLSLYRFEKYKKIEDNSIKSITVLGEEDLSIEWLNTCIDAVFLARDMINTPSNDMTPDSLSKMAEKLSNEKIKVKVLERDDIEKEGMGAYLAVSRGSNEPPKFIVIEYKGGTDAPLTLVGKSITFDSGGISLKQSEGMEKMKYDMAGGAVVIAVIKAASELQLPVNIVGILPATENLPGGSATRPGDVVRSITGKTIEIINTDAEGRLALADAIGYALKYYRPKAIIDLATLTGACSTAFGNEAIAMMGNNSEMINLMKKASEETYERVWQMPLYEEYRDYLKSDIADIKNSGGRSGSLTTSAFFLKEFVGDTPWIHLDIAGTAWNDKDKPYSPKGASGIGVRLMLNFLEVL